MYVLTCVFYSVSYFTLWNTTYMSIESTSLGGVVDPRTNIDTAGHSSWHAARPT